jgi:hypothetical protein
MSNYRLTKIGIAENPDSESAICIKEYRDKLLTESEMSPCIDYYVEGTIYTQPKKGESLIFYRHSRNGVKVDGVMTTSVVTDITHENCHTLFTTHNSIYKLEELN